MDSTPPYDLGGSFWSLSTRRTRDEAIGQGEILRPLQRPHPPIMVASMSPHSASVAAAARRGWSVISANFLQAVWVASHAVKLAEGWQAGGHAPRPADWRVARSIFVADDAATARRQALDPDGPYGHYYRSLMRKLIGNGRPDLFKTDAAMADGDITLDFVLRSLVIAGTATEVAERILALRAEVGEFGTLVYAGHDWAEPALARRSMELMATTVMPAVNRELGE